MIEIRHQLDGAVDTSDEEASDISDDNIADDDDDDLNVSLSDFSSVRVLDSNKIIFYRRRRTRRLTARVALRRNR